MFEQYPHLTIEQQLRVAFAYLAFPGRCGTLHKNLKYANKWVAWNRPFDEFPLLKYAKAFL